MQNKEIKLTIKQLSISNLEKYKIFFYSFETIFLLLSVFLLEIGNYIIVNCSRINSMKKILITYITLLLVGNLSAQVPNEKLVYTGSYKMSGLMTQLAQVTIQTKIVNTSKKSFLHCSWELVTFSKWDTYFKIRDLYESYVDPKTFKPSLYKRNVLEGSYTKIEKYTYSPDKRTINSTSKRPNKAETKKTFKVGANSMDIVSTIHKLRKVDFSKFKIGQTAPFVIIFDDKEYPVTVKYMGKETISAGNLGKRECFKLSIAAKTNKLKGKDQNIIWITTDSKRIPALIQFSISVGIGQIALLTAN